MSLFSPSSTCIGDGSGRLLRILAYQRQFLDVQQSGCAGRNLSGLDEWNVPPVDLVFFRSVWFQAVSSKPCFPDAIDYIKMKSYIINVDTIFRHAKYSAAFVSGRILRFHIPKFHQIAVTCWCVLPSDLVNKFEIATTSHTHRFIFTLPVFSATMNIRQFLHPFFHETVPVTYEPAVTVAVLNTALLCI